MSLTLLVSNGLELRATEESFNLVSAPSVADNASYWTCKVISRWGSVWGNNVWGLSPHSPSVICFPFPFPTFPSRGHSSRVLTRGSHQQRAAKGETLWQEEGLEQIDLWPPPSATSLPLGIKSRSQHIHTHAHMKKHLTHPAKPHGYPHILNLDHITLHKRRISPYLTLKHEAVLRSVYQKVPNLCWHKPSIWGYQQMQTLVQSGKGIFAPVQRWEEMEGLKKKHAKWCVSSVLYLPVLILSGSGARSHCMFLHPHEGTLTVKVLFLLFPIPPFFQSILVF